MRDILGIVDAAAILPTLSEYITKLDAKEWDWVIPRQDRVGTIVASLVEGVMWPVMSGDYWPSEYSTVQRQLIQTALVNLHEDPTLADRLSTKRPVPEANPWKETADQLDALVETMPKDDWTGQATEAQQLVRYVNAEAAQQIGNLVEKHSAFGAQDFPGAREKVLGVVRGAAAAAKRHGPYLPATGPHTVVNIEQRQEQRQAQQQASPAAASIDDVMAWEDLPDELRPQLEAMKEAKDMGDRPGFLQRSSDFAKKAEAFPSLMAKLGDAWEWVAGLF